MASIQVRSSSVAVLEGGCECGRNQYVIYVPTSSGRDENSPKVLFDVDSWSLRANAPPASVFLRVPLAWLHSTTYAFFPDETPALIRRSYTPRHAPASKRFFCGICAELLTVWSEESPPEAVYAHVNWHTLELESRILLNQLGLLPDENGAREHDNKPSGRATAAGSTLITADASKEEEMSGEGHASLTESAERALARSTGPEASSALNTLTGPDLPWFEAMLEGSALGRMRRRTGGAISGDGRTRVEWEIVDFGDDVDDASAEQRSQRLPMKRRLLDTDEAVDHTME